MRRRASAASASSALQRPRSAPFVERRRAPARRRARAPRRPGRAGRSRSRPRQPSWAIPAPIVPAPTTPIALDRLVIGPRNSACASRGRPACPRRGPRSPSPARRGGARARGRPLSPVSSAASTACLASRAASGGRGAITVAASSSAVVEPLLLASATLLTSPMLLGLERVDAPAGEDQLHRPLLADHAGQALGAAAAGDDPERDLGLAELGRLGGDDHVAGQRQLAAAAERPARDRGDQRRPASRRAAARRPAAGWMQRVVELALGAVRRCRRRRRRPRRSRR